MSAHAVLGEDGVGRAPRGALLRIPAVFPVGRSHGDRSLTTRTSSRVVLLVIGTPDAEIGATLTVRAP